MCDLRKCADTETAVMSELRESEIAKVPVARLFVIAGALVIAGAGCHCGCRLSLRVPAVIAGHDPQSSACVPLDPGSGPG
jgi:hypothetical protein